MKNETCIEIKISEKENITYRTIENWLKKGFSSKGEYIRYSNDKKEYIYVKPNKTHNNRQIIVNGKFYNSILDASKELNISWTTLKSYLEKKPNNNSIKYKNELKISLMSSKFSNKKIKCNDELC